MQNLRDKLKKVGLVNKAQAREAKTTSRRNEKLDKGAASRSLQEQKDRYDTKLAQQKAHAQHQQELINQARSREAELARIRDIIRAHAVLEPIGDDRLFYFLGRDQSIRRIWISYSLAAKLAAGQLALVEVDDDPERDYALVAADAAQRLEDLAPHRILFWCKPGENELPFYGAKE